MATIPAEKAPKPGLNIYGCPAVNPVKLTIAAEELGIPYNFINLEIFSAKHKSEWFSSINPNNRVPAIVHVKEDGTSVTVFESGACLLYMVSEFDKDHKLSYHYATPEYWTQLSWLSWQISGYGPMLGQATHFNRFVPEPVPYGAWRYTSESRRLNHVLEKRLATSPFVAGDRLTVADIAVFIFAHAMKWVGIDINDFPNIKAWHEKLAKRPAFQRGLQVPVPFLFSDEVVSNSDMDVLKSIRKGGAQSFRAFADEWQGEVVPLPSDHANYERSE